MSRFENSSATTSNQAEPAPEISAGPFLRRRPASARPRSAGGAAQEGADGLFFLQHAFVDFDAGQGQRGPAGDLVGHRLELRVVAHAGSAAGRAQLDQHGQRQALFAEVGAQVGGIGGESMMQK